jgi:hypothetical protein
MQRVKEASRIRRNRRVGSNRGNYCVSKILVVILLLFRKDRFVPGVDTIHIIANNTPLRSVLAVSAPCKIINNEKTAAL